jgi:dTDP-4-dehydrorhamnose 3,5-epimerase
MRSVNLSRSAIEGITTVPLAQHADRRGWLMEAFRDSWLPGVRNVQVNLMLSRANSLRGVHVHGRHSDWFVVVSGRALVGLKDVRRGSPSHGVVESLWLESDAPCALLVPPGVVHGLLFPVESLLATVESFHYDPGEELRCRWDDPALGMTWPCTDPLLSDQDRVTPSYTEMLRQYEGWRETP